LKLSVHALIHGTFVRAGEEIDEPDVSPILRKYAVTETSGNGEAGTTTRSKARTQLEAQASAAEPKLRKRYVKRGVAWRRVKDVAVKIGEPVFIKLGPSRYREIGCVSSDGKLPVERL
jgi:hypothetical protein